MDEPHPQKAMRIHRPSEEVLRLPSTLIQTPADWPHLPPGISMPMLVSLIPSVDWPFHMEVDWRLETVEPFKTVSQILMSRC